MMPKKIAAKELLKGLRAIKPIGWHFPCPPTPEGRSMPPSLALLFSPSLGILIFQLRRGRDSSAGLNERAVTDA
jgi:hypothetical protein